jgi:hypothetical protein
MKETFIAERNTNTPQTPSRCQQIDTIEVGYVATELGKDKDFHLKVINFLHFHNRKFR